MFGNAWTDTTSSNLQRSVLFPYNRSLGIYRCPTDKSTVRDQGKIQRTRSYSMSLGRNPATGATIKIDANRVVASAHQIKTFWTDHAEGKMI